MLFAPVRDCAEDVELKAVLELQMAYPYQQSPYDSPFSNPASPWSVDQQHQQPQTPIQAGTPSAHSNLTISPPVYQQQLSPESPVSILQNQPQQQSFNAPRTIQIEERVQPRPNQFRFETYDPSHFEQQRGSARSSSKPPARASGSGGGSGSGDKVTSSTSPSSSGAGPSRVPHGRAHATAAHPYRRPETEGRTSPLRTVSGVMSRTGHVAAGIRSASTAPSSVTPREHVDSEILAERTAPRPGRGVPSASLVGASKTAVPCPAMSSWRLSTYNNSDNNLREQGAVAGDEGAATTRYAAPIPSVRRVGESSRFQCSSFSPLRSPAADSPAPAPAESPATFAAPTATETPSRPLRLRISTDLWIEAASNEIVAMLELPGVKKEAVRIQLATCPHVGVPVLNVRCQTYSRVPDGVHAVKERRAGHCFRSINVPIGTKVSTPHVPLSSRSVTLVAERGRFCTHGGRHPHN